MLQRPAQRTDGRPTPGRRDRSLRRWGSDMKARLTRALALMAVCLLTACGNGSEADHASKATGGKQDSTPANYAGVTGRAATARSDAGVWAEADARPAAVQEITAKNGRFDKEVLVVPAGSAMQLTFVNEDVLPHNLAIYADDGMKEEVFRGNVITGPVAKEMVSFWAPGAGTYFFFCDAHIDMTGRLIIR